LDHKLGWLKWVVQSAQRLGKTEEWPRLKNALEFVRFKLHLCAHPGDDDPATTVCMYTIGGYTLSFVLT